MKQVCHLLFACLIISDGYLLQTHVYSFPFGQKLSSRFQFNSDYVDVLCLSDMLKNGRHVCC